MQSDRLAKKKKNNNIRIVKVQLSVTLNIV